MSRTAYRNGETRSGLSRAVVWSLRCFDLRALQSRPDYLKIARFAKENDVRRVLCLTATATIPVCEDICAAFDIDVEEGVFRATTYRSNLQLNIQTVEDDVKGSKRLERIITYLKANPGSTIVYCTTQAGTDSVAAALKDAKLDARGYHAGMSSDDRKSTQDWFMRNPKAIVCATIAFGMVSRVCLFLECAFNG